MREPQRRVIRHTLQMDQIGGFVQRAAFDVTVRFGWDEHARWMLCGLSTYGLDGGSFFSLNLGGIRTDPYVLQLSNGPGAAKPTTVNMERILFPCPPGWDGRGDVVPGVDISFDSAPFGGTGIGTVNAFWAATAAFYLTMQFMKVEE